MPFLLELDNFQGPFDLLLKLLDKQKLEITEISLSKVTADYLEYLSEMDIGIEEMNSFLFVAAKLSLDKSRAIIGLDSEDEIDIDLKESLIQYKAIKNQAAYLSKLTNNRMVGRKYSLYKSSKMPVLKGLELNNIYGKLMKDYGIKNKSHKIYSNKKYIDNYKNKFNIQIAKLKYFTVEDIMSKPSSRSEAIVFLISLLELLKSEAILKQNGKLKGASR